MIVTLVHVWVKTEFINEFIQCCIENHIESVKEKGNLRFDVLQDSSDPAKFVLYEAYESEEYAQAHKQTPHYISWRDKVAGWMAKPREGIKHTIIYPLNKTEW